MRTVVPVSLFLLGSASFQQTRGHEGSEENSLGTLLLAANPARRPRVSAARAGVNPSMKAKVGAYYNRPMQEWPGVTEPLGFFDPWILELDRAEGTKRFYREVELKHGRVAMLAALGFLVGEQFHPLFGGDIDVPSLIAFQETLSRLPLPTSFIYPAIVIALAIPEVYSTFYFEEPNGGKVYDARKWWKGAWKIRGEHFPGDYLGFDPLGLTPTDAEEMKAMQTKELNNGRLAMIGVAGMVAQELVTGEKIF